MSFSIEEGRLIITLLNFSTPLGSSTRKPIEIGTLEGNYINRICMDGNYFSRIV